MEIAKGIEMLQLEFQEFVIHPILYGMMKWQY